MGDYLYWTAAYGGQDFYHTLNWREPIQSVGFSTAARPALETFNNQLWHVHRGSGVGQELWRQSFNYNDGWSGESQIPKNTTPSGPALAAFNNQLRCVYEGSNTGANIFYIASADGSNWSAPQNIPNNDTSSGPGLAVFKHQLWCVYRGYYDNNLWVISSSDGHNWSSSRYIPGGLQTSMAPALAAFNDELWCVYRGNAQGDRRLYITKSSDGYNWSGQYSMSEMVSDCEPTLTCLSDRNLLMCVFGDTDSPMLRYAVSSGDPSNWRSHVISGVSRTPGRGAGLVRVPYHETEIVFCSFCKA